MEETAHLELQDGALSPGGRRASEEALERIWAEALRLPRVDVDANFFDIGGDSLKAMEVIVRIGEVLQVELPLIAFFEDATITHLADVVDELKGAATTAPMTRVPGRREFPLSYAQQVFWLLEQQNPGTGIYNTHRIFRMRGRVDAAVLERSLNELRRRQEILQVRFVQGVNGPVQVVEAGRPLRLAVTDLSAMERDAGEKAAMKVALETVREPFDLTSGPVLRAGLVRLGAEDSLLCMAMHHTVSDGFTGSILMEELGAIYNAFASGEPHGLPEPELHFTDYAAWEQTQDSRFERELEYWRHVLQGAPFSLDVPTDVPRMDDDSRHGHLRSVTASGDLLPRLQALAQANGTTLFTVLAAALRILLYRWSGQADFLLGTVSSNRSRAGTERMAGCFVNPLPLRNPVTAGQSVADLLQGEKQAVMEAFANQDCPFARIVEALNPERTSSDNPLFNAALVMQNFPVIALRGRSFEAEHVNFDAEVGLIDLRFIGMETPAGLQLLCEYKSPLFSDDTIDALLHAYAGVLEAAASNPVKVVSEIAIPEQLMRQAKAARQRDHQPALAIAASFTAQPVEEPLNFLLGELGMRYRVAFAPYQQVFQQLLDPMSPVRTADGFGIVLVRFEDWLPRAPGANGALREKLEGLAQELIEALRRAEGGVSPVIVCFCPASRAIAAEAGSGWLHNLEAKVAKAFGSGSLVHVLESDALLDLYPVENPQDEYAQRLGNVPYTTDFFSALATMLVRRMWSIAENRCQVIAMECDQVLWSGRCGEKRELVVDEVRDKLMNLLLEQRDAGMLLCLCSRNREEDVWAAFDRNPGMPIQRDDIVAAAIGPESSPELLARLARELGIELDRFIFLNADAAECAAMEVAHPEVLTSPVPSDPAEIPAWLKHVWAFDRQELHASGRAV